jgi:hypothetical protein
MAPQEDPKPSLTFGSQLKAWGSKSHTHTLTHPLIHHPTQLITTLPIFFHTNTNIA